MIELWDAEQGVLMGVEAAAAGVERPKQSVYNSVRKYDQDQQMLLVRDIWGCVPTDHPARWVNDLGQDSMDSSALCADYTMVRGTPVLDPHLAAEDVDLRLLAWAHVVAGVGAALP